MRKSACQFRILVIVMSVALTSTLWADPNDQARYTKHLDRDKKSLGKMQAGRDKDQAHMDQVQKDLSADAAKLSLDHAQQRHDVEQLKSVEGQVTAGRNQENLDKKSYNDAVKKYGRDDPASTTAKQTLKER